ncbi:unnamed protein product [Victoria cruziana]
MLPQIVIMAPALALRNTRRIDSSLE